MVTDGSEQLLISAITLSSFSQSESSTTGIESEPETAPLGIVI